MQKGHFYDADNVLGHFRRFTCFNFQHKHNLLVDPKQAVGPYGLMLRSLLESGLRLTFVFYLDYVRVIAHTTLYLAETTMTP